MKPAITKSQSLDRGLELLEYIHHAERPMGTREIARALGLSPAIVQRLLNTLYEWNYLRRDPESKKYLIGYKTLMYGSALAQQDRLLKAGQRELEEVTRNLGLDSFMATLQGTRACYLACLQGEGPVIVNCKPGGTIPLHSTAIGKCILSAMSDEEARALLGSGPLQAITDKTITDPEVLLEHVALTRQRGYSVVDGENIEGFISVGALINLPSGFTPTAISLSFIPMIAKNIDIVEAANIIRSAAERIGRNI